MKPEPDRPPLIRYYVSGARQWNNYFWSTVALVGGLGFFLTGLSSFFQFAILPFISFEAIQFFPQGLLMCFEGLLGLYLGIYGWLSLIWTVGDGFNEINFEERYIRIFRWGFPGNDRVIVSQFRLANIDYLRLNVQDRVTDRKALYLNLRKKREIPLTRIGQSITIQALEKQAVELAQLLDVPLIGL